MNEEQLLKISSFYGKKMCNPRPLLSRDIYILDAVCGVDDGLYY